MAASAFRRQVLDALAELVTRFDLTRSDRYARDPDMFPLEAIDAVQAPILQLVRRLMVELQTPGATEGSYQLADPAIPARLREFNAQLGAVMGSDEWQAANDNLGALASILRGAGPQAQRTIEAVARSVGRAGGTVLGAVAPWLILAAILWAATRSDAD